MTTYIIKRVALIVPTLFIVSAVAFSLVRLMPGDVVLAQLAESPEYRAEDVQRLREDLGLDRSWVAQYAEWGLNLFRGDLGVSLWTGDSILGTIAERLLITIELAILAFVLANLVGCTFGIFCAIYQDGVVDQGLRFLSTVFLAIPTFWIGTLVVVFGSRYFGYLPPLQHQPLFEEPIANARQFLVPAAILAIPSAAALTRLVRSSMLEVLRQDYIRTAYAKGLRQRTVVLRHAARNAALPVVTYQGTQLSILLTGSVVLEIVFGLPGIGRLVYDSIMVRDYPLLQGIILIFGAIFVLINLVVDLSYGVLDPRIQVQRTR